MRTPHPFGRARSRAFLFALLAAPSLALVPASAVHASACGDTYTVRPGDTLWGIGVTCGVAVSEMQRLNRLGVYLQPGQVLRLSDPNLEQSYLVQPGDTLTGIGLRLGVPPAILAAANGLGSGNLIRAGQVLHWRSTDRSSGPATAVKALPPTQAPSTSATTSSAATAYVTYQVKPGDTLWDIAAARHLSPDTLASANNITNARLLRAGTVLRIPVATPAQPAASASLSPLSPSGASSTTTIVRSGVYRVQPGDTLSGIALALGLTPDALAGANGLTLSTPIQPGQVLRYAIVLYAGPSQAAVGSVLNQQSTQVGIENALLKAIAFRESSWRMVDAADGGIGVMQLMPDTVTWLKNSYVPGGWDPHNLTDNVHAGAVLLLVYDRLYAGNIISVAEAYHGGMGAVTPTPNAEMQRYLAAVQAFRQIFLNGGFPT